MRYAWTIVTGVDSWRLERGKLSKCYQYCYRNLGEMASGSTPTEVISLSGLFKYFKDYTSLIDKGEIKYKNGYVLQVKLLDMEIEAVVRASIGDQSYTVKITVNGSGDILKLSCSCYRGQWNWRVKNRSSKHMVSASEKSVKNCQQCENFRAFSKNRRMQKKSVFQAEQSWKRILNFCMKN